MYIYIHINIHIQINIYIYTCIGTEQQYHQEEADCVMFQHIAKHCNTQ